MPDSGLEVMQLVRPDHTQDKTASNGAAWERSALGSVLEALPQAILLISDSHGVEYVNQAFCDFHGIAESPADLCGLSPRAMMRLIHPQWKEPERNWKRIEKLLSEWEYKRENEVELNDGRVISFDWTPIDLADRVRCRLWASQDITERKRYEALAVQRESDLVAMLEGPPMIVILTDGTEQKVLKANSRLYETLGFTANDFQDVDGFWPLAYPDSSYREQVSTEWIRRITQAIRDQSRIEPMETRVTCKDGSIKYIEWGFIAAGNRNVTYGLDRTGYRRAERERERFRNLNYQLEKSRSLDRMAGAIAHHFNNQLHAVLLSLQIASDELPDDSEVVHLLQSARTAAESAASVSGKLLTYLGLAHPTLKPVQLSTLCNRVISSLAETAPAGVRLDLSIAPATPSIMGKEALLEQALQALVTNAWESCNKPVHDIRITLDTVQREDIGRAKFFPATFSPHAETYVRLGVSDHGGGINPQDHDRIFEPFFSSKFVGRGLGLPMTLGIARSHDAAIQLESKPGRGSTFWMYFPATS